MTAKQGIAWLQAAWKDDKKRINLLLVSGLAGMLLLCMSEWLPAGQSTQNAAPTYRAAACPPGRMPTRG